ncbi:hypothetical protein EU803_15230 [Loktanella sp. IMCC34160]|uniref:hypothetical protein n=1 Tax=Loktanella sp. IMCC34160 TaxID=2510646 RepID=UPI0010EAB78B|nr:hypothetical protein [Loktanella sp. IMCC34160]RYG89969.1 hypothetical protein EU803_15230 [Loktanella sp. IMCC34160]
MKAHGVLRHGQLARRLNHLDPVTLGEQKQVGELPVSTFASHAMFSDPVHGIGQLPAYEVRSVTQGTRLAVQQGKVVPGFKLADVAGEAALMLGDDPFSRYQHDPTSIGT